MSELQLGPSGRGLKTMMRINVPCLARRNARKTSRGFTVLEVMIAVSIFAIVTGAALALFHFQSKKGAGSAMRKTADEAVALAVMQLRRDILRAGMGLTDGPKTMEPCGATALEIEANKALAVRVVQGGTGKPDTLLVNFTDHLSTDLVATLTDMKTPRRGSFFGVFSNTPFGQSTTTMSYAWWQLAVGATQFEMPGMNTSFDRNSIGGVIFDKAPFFKFDHAKSSPEPVVETVSGSEDSATRTQKLSVKWTTGVPNSCNAAPAIAYGLLLDYPPVSGTKPDAWKHWGRLFRNGVPIIGTADDENRPPNIKVTDFRVRCGFYITNPAPIKDFSTYYTDRSRTEAWAPGGGTFGDICSGFTAENLRVVEVTICYIYRDKGGGHYYPDAITTEVPAEPFSTKPLRFRIAGDMTPGPWALGGVYTVTFSPRTLVLGKQIGSEPL